MVLFINIFIVNKKGKASEEITSRKECLLQLIYNIAVKI